MKVIKNFSGNYDEDPVRFLDFENYANKFNEDVEFYFGHPPSNLIFEKNKKFKILFTLEEQYSNNPKWHDPLNIQQYEEYVTKCWLALKYNVMIQKGMKCLMKKRNTGIKFAAWNALRYNHMLQRVGNNFKAFRERKIKTQMINYWN